MINQIYIACTVPSNLENSLTTISLYYCKLSINATVTTYYHSIINQHPSKHQFIQIHLQPACCWQVALTVPSNNLPYIQIYYFTNSMTTKLDRIKLPPSRGLQQPPLPPPVTQTIIINNPNININFLNDHHKPAGPLSSRGLDNWNLNNNLKEFSQTRQLGFFKHKKDRNKSNSPYIIHKVRTQDLRSINKIYAPSQTNPLKDTLTHLQKHETISHIAHPSIVQPTPKDTEPQNPLQKLIARHDKTVTQKFYQARMKKQATKEYQTLPTHYINTTNPEISAPKSFRRDRFEIATLPLTERKFDSRESKESADQPQKYVKIEEKEERINDSQESEKRGMRQIVPRMVPLQLRKRAFNKTIAKINQALLSNTDDYFQRFQTEKLPQTQIELLVNSVSHPEQTTSPSRAQIPNASGWGVYEFEFEQQRKKRPKTPKRKKQYEQEDEM